MFVILIKISCLIRKNEEKKRFVLTIREHKTFDSRRLILYLFIIFNFSQENLLSDIIIVFVELF